MLVLIQRTDPRVGMTDLVPVGKFKIELGSGMLSLNNQDHVSPVFPLRRIRRVVIRLKRTDILEAEIRWLR